MYEWMSDDFALDRLLSLWVDNRRREIIILAG